MGRRGRGTAAGPRTQVFGLRADRPAIGATCRSFAARAATKAPTPEEISQVETFVWPYASLLPGEMVLQPLFDPTAAAAAAPFPMRQTESSKLLAAALPALESAVKALAFSAEELLLSSSCFA